MSVNHCLILNLEERTDLWDSLADFRTKWEKKNKKWTRIPGVDYRMKSNVLNEMILTNRIDLNGIGFQHTKTVFLGELGCYMGHYNCWKYVVDHQLETCLILEDGIDILRHDFENLVTMSDILFVNEEMQMIGKNNFIGYGTQGYVVTQKGAEFLLKNCYTLFFPIDIQIRNICNTLDINANTAFPPYVRRNQNRISSISLNIQEPDKNKKQCTFSILERILANLIKQNINLDELI